MDESAAIQALVSYLGTKRPRAEAGAGDVQEALTGIMAKVSRLADQVDLVSKSVTQCNSQIAEVRALLREMQPKETVRD